jgi:hypothetical protein
MMTRRDADHDHTVAPLREDLVPIDLNARPVDSSVKVSRRIRSTIELASGSTGTL